MSWYNDNQFQHPPPGVFPPSTNNKPSLLGNFPLPGHPFQQTCPPQGGLYFTPDPQLMDPHTMRYFPPSMIYNTSQYPSTLFGSPATYPFQMPWTDQRNSYSLPPPNNYLVPRRERIYSVVTDQPALQENKLPIAQAGAEACVVLEERRGQHQYQQQIEEQEQGNYKEQGIYEEQRPASRQQREGWQQRREKSKPEATDNQSFMGKQLEKQITNQSVYKHWDNNLDVRESRGFKPRVKQEYKNHREERQKTATQTQSRGQHEEKRNQSLGSKLETPRTQQRGKQQLCHQTEITKGSGLNPPIYFYSSRKHSKSNLKANSTPPVTKHKQRPYSAGHTPYNNNEEILIKTTTSNARFCNDRGGMNQTHSNPASNKHRNEMRQNTHGCEVTHSSNPIPEFSGMRLKTGVTLDEYCSDLNAEIGQGGCNMATRNTPSGFRLLYAGAKANVGVSKGKVFFEAKITQNLESNCSNSLDAAHPNIALIGWSEGKTSLELGEEFLSFGYDSSGKFSTEDTYRDYGEPFKVNDVIGALIDLDSQPCTISFMKNGKHFEIAEYFSAHNVDGKKNIVMFPHVYLKNCKIDLNFGQQGPWFSPPQGYEYIDHLQPCERVNGLKPPTRQEKEVIMTVGLPGAGKTTWVKKKQQQNPGKKYYILGTDHLIEKMRVVDQPRISYSERFETLYKLADECFQVLLDIASKSNRNFILDQTNVVLRARERKMSIFSEFYRIAVVIQPCDKELERRSWERTEKFGKIVPLTTLCSMKEQYSLPSGSTWDEIIYTELNKDQARALVNQYNRCLFYDLSWFQRRMYNQPLTL